MTLTTVAVLIVTSRKVAAALVAVVLCLSACSPVKGVVSGKEYDDEDLVSVKPYIMDEECFRIFVVTDGDGLQSFCVSESQFNSIDIGDYVDEEDYLD